MAGKGKGAAQLQVKLDNDQDWDTMLKNTKGLIVIDVYTDWCGPCIAMMSNLKKVKLEQGGDNLHLAQARADAITVLSRFRGRSEPTWLLVAGGQLVKVLFGTDSPQLIKVILKELEKEIKVLEGTAERKGVGWNELTEDEQIKAAEVFAKKEMEAERLKLEEDMAKDRAKRRNLTRIARRMPNQTVVVYFPHGIKEPETSTGKRVCQAAYRVMVRCDVVGLQIADQLDLTLTREDIEQMLYNSPIVLPEEMLKNIHERQCIVSLIQKISPIALERRHSSTSRISVISVGDVLNVIEDSVASLIYGDTRDPHNPREDSVVKIYEVELESGTKIPPCWTPVDFISKAAAMQILFPQKVRVLDVIEEPMPPPAYLIIFEAKRAKEVLDVAEPFASDVLHLAYFTSDDPGTAEKICHLLHELEKKGEEVIESAKMVIALERTKSDPMLTLAALGPLYISPDTRSGTREVETWFPPKIEWQAEPDPWEPPPPPPIQYWQDEDENFWMEEERTCSDGEIRLGRRLVRLADGTPVEDGEWKPITDSEPELPPVKVKDTKKEKKKEKGK
ncbi:hypothetical protein GE061_003553 [Apolygus lucorum]|uniref:Thioredoxin domain-containing protein n=1 Tax=Apolygus lucorum TaxID=248454 RepID=A0A6A4JEK7_APOLU|nr:hypothetical protein GE061_003553 [Apolygus lucorum]